MRTQISTAAESTEARHQAVAAGVRSVKLEGFALPGPMQVINARFVRGEITMAERLAQAYSLCDGIARESRPRSA